MDRAEIDRLEHLLAHTGELASAILILIPLGVELAVRYGVNTGVALWVGLVVAYGLLEYLREFTKLGENGRFVLILINYLLSFALIVWLLSAPLSPLVFIGVILSTFVVYVFPSRGVLWTIGIFNLILITIFWIQNHGNLDAIAYSQLLSTVSMMSLMIIFCSSLISLNQGEIGELNETYKKLRSEHLRLVSLVNTLGDAVVATDSSGKIQTYNGAALELLDTNASLSGKKLDEIWNLVDAQGRSVKLIEESQRINTSFRRNDLIIKYGDKDQANLYINITPLKVGFGAEAQQGFTFIMRDITKEKSLDEERDEFVSVVSHELRTPVTITEGKISNAQLMLTQPKVSPERLNGALKAAHEQVVFLANMINDLAALARAEREDAELELGKVSPAELLSELQKSYEPEIKQKGLSISLHTPAQPIEPIYTSRLYLQEILQNFITNASKYTKTGGITLSASPVQGGVKFAVTDTGIGISTSDLKRIFEKFFRSEDFRTRENSGTGLGLYVTQKLAKKINGKIDVESKLDEGSTFSITLSPLPVQAHRERDRAS